MRKILLIIILTFSVMFYVSTVNADFDIVGHKLVNGDYDEIENVFADTFNYNYDYDPIDTTATGFSIEIPASDFWLVTEGGIDSEIDLGGVVQIPVTYYMTSDITNGFEILIPDFDNTYYFDGEYYDISSITYIDINIMLDFDVIPTGFYNSISSYVNAYYYDDEVTINFYSAGLLYGTDQTIDLYVIEPTPPTIPYWTFFGWRIVDTTILFNFDSAVNLDYVDNEGVLSLEAIFNHTGGQQTDVAISENIPPFYESIMTDFGLNNVLGYFLIFALVSVILICFSLFKGLTVIPISIIMFLWVLFNAYMGVLPFYALFIISVIFGLLLLRLNKFSDNNIDREDN